MSLTLKYFESFWPIIISSASVYIFIIAAIRLFGKKEFAQLSVVDLVFVLLISNAVQNAMVGSDTSLAGGLIAATTLFAINALLKYLTYRFPGLRLAISGEPRMLIYQGKVNEENLRREHISINELLETIHEHGSHSIQDVDLAILESDGNISVLSGDFKKRTVKPRKRIKKLLT
jgi:uncharacterized membrane protein YcaP (DUF421 family)